MGVVGVVGVVGACAHPVRVTSHVTTPGVAAQIGF
jgi:hypothetical protein